MCHSLRWAILFFFNMPIMISIKKGEVRTLERVFDSTFINFANSLHVFLSVLFRFTLFFQVINASMDVFAVDLDLLRCTEYFILLEHAL